MSLGVISIHIDQHLSCLVALLTPPASKSLCRGLIWKFLVEVPAHRFFGQAEPVQLFLVISDQKTNAHCLWSVTAAIRQSYTALQGPLRRITYAPVIFLSSSFWCKRVPILWTKVRLRSDFFSGVQRKPLCADERAACGEKMYQSSLRT